jgi:type III secretory pathway component EscT
MDDVLGRPLLEGLGLEGSPSTLLACALLLVARLVPLAWLAPWMAPVGSPAIVRTATLFALVTAMLGLASSTATVPANAATFAIAIVRELVVGLAIAITTSIPLVALEHVGRALDAWRPSREDAEGTFTRLYAALAAAAFVAIGGTRVAVRAIGDGLVSLPLGATLVSADARGMALDTARVLATAITFVASLAAPALVALFAAELGIALAVRGARLGRTLDAAISLRGGLVIGAALLGIAAALPELPALTRWALAALP